MTLPIPFFRSQLPPEVPAIVRVVSQNDVQWNRPVFKAPPLRVEPPIRDVRTFLAEAAAGNSPASGIGG